jgi:phage repressor protein C with HTH and peptisase S24 domain
VHESNPNRGLVNPKTGYTQFGYAKPSFGMPSRVDIEAGQRLLALRKKAQLTRPALAAAVKAHPNQIQKLENGERKITVDWIDRLSGPLGIKPDEFLQAAGAQAVSTVHKVEGIDYARLPAFDIRASAGYGSIVEEGDPIGWRLFDLSWLKSVTPSKLDMLAVIQVAGDSMTDTLANGDQVLVDFGRKTLAQPGIFVLRLDGELIVKRVQKSFQTGAVTLISDNARYPQEVIDAPDRLDVIGRVVWIGRSVG